MEPVAVKVVGEKTELLIDREAEARAVVALSAQGFGPKVRQEAGDSGRRRAEGRHSCAAEAKAAGAMVAAAALSGRGFRAPRSAVELELLPGSRGWRVGPVDQHFFHWLLYAPQRQWSAANCLLLPLLPAPHPPPPTPQSGTPAPPRPPPTRC